VRHISLYGRQVPVACWEVRSQSAMPWATEIDSEHEAREELRCAQRRGLDAQLFAITEDGIRVEVPI